MHAMRLFLCLFGLASVAIATPTPAQPCPPFSGDFVIEAQALYPENMDFDSIHCKLYVGANYNASVLVYDPYTKAQTVLTWPGITLNETLHMSGIDFDEASGLMFFSANAGAPWETNGANLTGPDFLISYNTNTNTTVYISDMTPVLSTLEASTGRAINGFQDQAEDGAGNSYAVATFGGAVFKVAPAGKASLYYVGSNNSTNYSIGSITAVSPNKIVFFNSETAELLYFNTSKPVGDSTGELAVATPIPLSGIPSGTVVVGDGMTAPSKYCNGVLLAANDAQDSVIVMRSEDGWNTAEYLGSIPNNFSGAAGGLATAQVEIAGSIFVNEEFFNDPGLFNRTANRTAFPFYDITASVAALVGY